jgi:hypothetical protein
MNIGGHMNINIKSLTAEMVLKNKGMELQVRNNKDEFLGDMAINKRGMTWCPGKTSVKNGVQMNWEEIIDYFESKK